MIHSKLDFRPFNETFGMRCLSAFMYLIHTEKKYEANCWLEIAWNTTDIVSTKMFARRLLFDDKTTLTTILRILSGQILFFENDDGFYSDYFFFWSLKEEFEKVGISSSQSKHFGWFIGLL